MSIIYINGLSVAGKVGTGTSMPLAVDDLWRVYWRWLDRHADGPVCPLRKFAVWSVGGVEIEPPESWFVKI